MMMRLALGVMALLFGTRLWAGDEALRFVDISKSAALEMKPRSQHPNKDVALARAAFVDVYARGYFWHIQDVTFLDADGDGNLDIYLLNQPLGRWCRLWLGDGKGGFSELESDRFQVTWEDDKKRPKALPGPNRALPFDFGGRGAQDVLLSTSDPHGYRFRLLTESPEKDGKAARNFFGTHHWINGTAALLTDVDGDGCVDFFVGGQRFKNPTQALLCGTFPAYEKTPDGAGQLRSRLRFEVEPERTAILLPIGEGSVAADFHGDGRADLLCRGTPGVRLLRNLGNRRFDDVTGASGLSGLPASGPIAVADFNNDGLLDIVCGMRLFLNQGAGKFKDVTADSGIGSAANASGTGTATVGDFNNDGLLDLLVCDGSANRLFLNLGGGRFKDITKSSGLIETVATGSSNAAGDIDNDGRLDLLVVSPDRGPALYRNASTNANHWLAVRLRGPRGNAEAAGAQVTVYAVGKLGTKNAILGHQERIVASEFKMPCPLHFGLGKHEKCDVRALFPGGKTVERRNVAVNATITIAEADATPR